MLVPSIQEGGYGKSGELSSLTFKWAKDDIVSAQRLRFRCSPIPRIVGGIGVIASVGLAGEVIYFWLRNYSVDPVKKRPQGRERRAILRNLNVSTCVLVSSVGKVLTPHLPTV